MSEPTLEQIAESPLEAYAHLADSEWTTFVVRFLAREIIALRETVGGTVNYAAWSQRDDEITARLDSHNRVMASIVRRVRALEGGGVECTCGIVPQPPGPNHGPRCPAEVAPKTIELLRGMVDRAKQQQDKAERAAVESYQRAETAERERDAFREQHETCDRDRDRLRSDAAIARASVERLREAICRLTSGGKLHPKDCAKGMRDPLGLSDDHFDCTCGLTAALEDA